MKKNLNRLRTNKSLKLKNKICFEFGRRHFRIGMNFDDKINNENFMRTFSTFRCFSVRSQSTMVVHIV